MKNYPGCSYLISSDLIAFVMKFFIVICNELVAIVFLINVENSLKSVHVVRQVKCLLPHTEVEQILRRLLI